MEFQSIRLHKTNGPIMACYRSHQCVTIWAVLYQFSSIYHGFRGWFRALHVLVILEEINTEHWYQLIADIGIFNTWCGEQHTPYVNEPTPTPYLKQYTTLWVGCWFINLLFEIVAWLIVGFDTYAWPPSPMWLDLIKKKFISKLSKPSCTKGCLIS